MIALGAQILAALLNPVLVLICLSAGFLVSLLPRDSLEWAAVTFMIWTGVAVSIGSFYPPIISHNPHLEVGSDGQHDPSYRAYDDIVGTKYEQLYDRFIPARNEQHVIELKAWIDHYESDCHTVLTAADLFRPSYYQRFNTQTQQYEVAGWTAGGMSWDRACLRQSQIATSIAALILAAGQFGFVRWREGRS